MSLATTYLEARLAAGKTMPQIMSELARAHGRPVARTTLFRWQNGERSPGRAVREVMLRAAIPHVIPMFPHLQMPGKTEIEKLARALL